MKRGLFDCFKRSQEPLTAASFVPEKGIRERSDIENLIDEAREGGNLEMSSQAAAYLKQIVKTIDARARKSSTAYDELEKLRSLKIDDISADEVLILAKVMRLSSVRDDVKTVYRLINDRLRSAADGASNRPPYGASNQFEYTSKLGEIFKALYPDLKDEIKYARDRVELKEMVNNLPEAARQPIVFFSDGHTIAVYVDGLSKIAYIIDGAGMLDTAYIARTALKGNQKGLKVYTTDVSRQRSSTGCKGFALHDLLAMSRIGPDSMAEFANAFISDDGILRVMPAEFHLSLQSMTSLETMNHIWESFQKLQNPTIDDLLSLRPSYALKDSDPLSSFFETIAGLKEESASEQADAMKQIGKALRMTSHPDEETPFNVVRRSFALQGQNILVESDMLGYFDWLHQIGMMKPHQ